MKKGKKNKNKHKCPSCIKKYQSIKDLERHCLNQHRKTLKELQVEKDSCNMTLGDFMNTGDDEK
ncbi:hypothetical protein KAU43_03675 [candidate division WOR-3 bacterium]|nr:hypothetical protein [candidate division WOR-3 bacterium]